MATCAYCNKTATGNDALGLPSCVAHTNEADDYFEQRTGRRPSDDPFLYCPVHCDMWEPKCERCEACSQHHYGKSVAEFLRSPESRHITVVALSRDEELDPAMIVDELLGADRF